MSITALVLIGPKGYEEMGVCGVFFDDVDAGRAAERAPQFYGVDSVPEQYVTYEVPVGMLLDEDALGEA